MTPAAPRVSNSMRSLLIPSGRCFDRSRVRLRNLSRSSLEVRLSMSSKQRTSTMRPVMSPWRGIISRTATATRSRLMAPRTHRQRSSWTRLFKFWYASLPRLRRLASGTVGRLSRTHLTLQQRMGFAIAWGRGSLAETKGSGNKNNWSTDVTVWRRSRHVWRWRWTGYVLFIMSGFLPILPDGFIKRRIHFGDRKLNWRLDFLKIVILFEVNLNRNLGMLNYFLRNTIISGFKIREYRKKISLKNAVFAVTKIDATVVTNQQGCVESDRFNNKKYSIMIKVLTPNFQN